jgi:Na+/glutamate symporter
MTPCSWKIREQIAGTNVWQLERATVGLVLVMMMMTMMMIVYFYCVHITALPESP